ncbi:glycoside hydrolase family 88 protein [Planctomycetaceae bacterium]|nr:glycoside hydrolase family 88 protein [bacterium]MDC0262115.1 glycoside hydrolase family 88 protein [Planctomycetaceae bacterium]MDC0307945.1 glycoside hydrolase family 88 protein [Planctomycetaceae bacterium]
MNLSIPSLIVLLTVCVSQSQLQAQPVFEEGNAVPFEICSHPQATPISGLASYKFLGGDFKQRQVLFITADTANRREVIKSSQLFHAQAGTSQVARDLLRVGGLFTTTEVIDSKYPPESKTPYYSSDQISQKYLWRSLGWLAPDMVIVWKEGETIKVGLPKSASDEIRTACKKRDLPLYDLEETHLASALTSAKQTPANIGHIPAIEIVCTEKLFDDVVYGLLNHLATESIPQISSAHTEMIDRRFRTPLELAQQLDTVYGHHLKNVSYQPALSLIARLNLDDLLGDNSRHAEAEKIVAEYASGKKPALGNKPNGSVTAGHLIFSELAHRVDKDKYTPLVKISADQIFDQDDKPRPAMPAHSEMSDAVFMGGPILAAAGNLTGDQHYYDLCLNHVRFMQKLCLRKDGIYRHSPLDEAAWGRGNGFPSLGLALVLSEIPETHPVHQELRQGLNNHLRALIKHQDPTGMWHQIIDEPGSYREMTSTCMITFAILRGLRNGWLEKTEFSPAINRAMPALMSRISPTGELIDVCTGTGKQKNRQAYYDRTAILGKDERGGAMAFLVVTEYARYLQERPARSE